MNNFLDSLPRDKHHPSFIDMDKIAHPLGPPMSVEMLMERGTDLAATMNMESDIGITPETIERAVYFLGEISIAGRTTDGYKDRRWLFAASSFWASVLCLETDLHFSLPHIDKSVGKVQERLDV